MKKQLTQRESIKIYLKKNKKITPLQALNLFSCFRLGSRIWELREEGMKIKTQFIPFKNKYGKGTFAQYVLK